ncbi:outer-membrane lipoprotein carrier protein LolA [Candidatus Pelagibacter sp.]|jgi:outer membrane lipoprotein-sorting protein|nr:outer-membrane lipoprotein carrier protein LolA [Candidatus Pelagibacter sp.]
MFRCIVIFFFSFLILNVNATNKEEIIQNLNSTENLEFKFEQNINGKIENGYCTIVYPKKIFCEYARSNNKILVSNGKSLVIKTRSSYYRYPLDKTPLNLILDKDFLINKIYSLEERIIDNNLINYTILHANSKINIFFDIETFNLIGWQNTDIYQNFNITFLSSIRKNRVISKNLFVIPQPN